MANDNGVDTDKVGELLEKARDKGGVAQREPVALYGLIAFGIAVLAMVIAGAAGVNAVGSIITGIVMLAQIFFVRRAVFAPTTADKLVQAARGA
ncbi:MAG: hypothetical protein M3198_17420 [Actinomycetota bacterium]|nr:hypothetical protein [Actinomycetota bacterium]